MYQLIYSFILDNLLTGNDLENYVFSLGTNSINLRIWLCHSLSIISIVLIFIFCVLFVKWFFRLGAGLLTLR